MGVFLWLLAGCLTPYDEYLAMREGLMDRDGDGYRALIYGGGDCEDDDPGIYPGAPEDCGAIDRDCDGRVDEGAADLARGYLDGDGDGYGDPGVAIAACALPPRAVALAGDCDDADPAVYPGAPERCDGRDADCDGRVDEGLDRDGDGWSRCGSGGPADCDDRDPAISPGASEVCDDGLDNDCDGRHDCALTGELALWYADVWIPGRDGEGLGMELAADGRGRLLVAGAPSGSALLLIADPAGDARETRLLGGEALGRSAAVADLDGDGVPEAIAGALGAVWRIPSGGELGATAELADIGSALLGESSFGQAVAALPGAAGSTGSLLIGEPGGRSGGGSAWLLPGTASSSEEAAAVVYGAAGDGVGEAVALGDLDGDGLAELLASGAGGVGIFAGSSEGWLAWSDAEVILPGAAPLALAGDVDGDGRGDVLAGAEPGRLYAGGSWEELAAIDGGAGSLSSGDVDGDGRRDVLMGDVPSGGLSGEPGSVAVFYGPVAGTLAVAEADLRLVGSAPGELAGRALAADLDGDAHAEILVGAPGAGGGDGGIYILMGRGL